MALVMAHSVAFQQWSGMTPRPATTEMFHWVLQTIHGHFAGIAHIREALLENWDTFTSILPVVLQRPEVDLLQIQLQLLADLHGYLESCICPRRALQQRIAEQRENLKALWEMETKQLQQEVAAERQPSAAHQASEGAASAAHEAEASKAAASAAHEAHEAHEVHEAEASKAAAAESAGSAAQRAAAAASAARQAHFEVEWTRRCQLKTLAGQSAKAGSLRLQRLAKKKRSAEQSGRAKQVVAAKQEHARHNAAQKAAVAAFVASEAANAARRCVSKLDMVVDVARVQLAKWRKANAEFEAKLVVQRAASVAYRAVQAAHTQQQKAAQWWCNIADRLEVKQRQDARQAYMLQQRIPLKLFLQALLPTSSDRYNLVLLDDGTPCNVLFGLTACDILPLLPCHGGGKYVAACIILCPLSNAMFCAAWLGFLGFLGPSPLMNDPETDHSVWESRIDVRHNGVQRHRFICAMPIHKLQAFTKYFALHHLAQHLAAATHAQTKPQSPKKKKKAKKNKLPEYEVHIKEPPPPLKLHWTQIKARCEAKLRLVTTHEHLLPLLPGLLPSASVGDPDLD